MRPVPDVERRKALREYCQVTVRVRCGYLDQYGTRCDRVIGECYGSPDPPMLQAWWGCTDVSDPHDLAPLRSLTRTLWRCPGRKCPGHYVIKGERLLLAFAAAVLAPTADTRVIRLPLTGSLGDIIEETLAARSSNYFQSIRTPPG